MLDTPEEAAEKVQKAIIEMVTRIYERASAYTNLVLLGGYAGESRSGTSAAST